MYIFPITDIFVAQSSNLIKIMKVLYIYAIFGVIEGFGIPHPS